MLNRQPQPDRTAPVVHHHGRVAQVQSLHQPAHQLDVALVAVPAHVGRLIRAPEPGEVGGDAAMTGLADRRYDLAPQERPRRLAVEEDHRRPVPVLDVREPQSVRLALARLERELRQVGEALVGRPVDGGHASPSPSPSPRSRQRRRESSMTEIASSRENQP